MSAQTVVDRAGPTDISGPFSDMTSVLRRSDQDDKERAKFITDTEFGKTEQEIKEAFLSLAPSFDDLLAVMGVAKPGFEGKITYNDFSRAVGHYCMEGARAKYSSFQVKFVFQN